MLPADTGGWGTYSESWVYADGFLFYFALVVCACGLLNNAFVLFILWEKQELTQFRILKSMAFTDLCANLVMIYLVIFPDKPLPGGFWGDLLCGVIFSQYLLFSLSAASAWQIVLLTFDLYGAQVQPVIYTKLLGTRVKTFIVVVFSWVLGFYSMINDTWSFFSEQGQCHVIWRPQGVRLWTEIQQIILTIPLPLGIMLWSYFKLFSHLREEIRHHGDRAELAPSSRVRQCLLKGLLRTLSVRTAFLLFVYIITWIPHQTFWSIYILGSSPTSTTILDTWYGVASHFPPVFNAALNPILYGWSWFEFRNSAWHKLANVSRAVRVCRVNGHRELQWNWGNFVHMNKLSTSVPNYSKY